jgi:4'-phosphopantetheinyl transferase
MKEVHSWSVRLDVAPDDYSATLADDERARSARLRFEHDRRRFIVARGALRTLLGRYLGIHPAAIRFVYNSYGKPELSPDLSSGLRFNLSHSADLALIAIAADAAVGVDVEQIRPQPDAAAIGSLHLNDQAFFRWWTRKEAYVKARGEGLELDAASPDPAPPRGWTLHPLHPAPGYVGALAIEGSGWRLRQWQWEEGL